MNDFEQRISRDALHLMRAAANNDADRCRAIVAQSDSVALATTLAATAANLVTKVGPLDDYITAGFEHMREEENRRREQLAAVREALFAANPTTPEVTE